MERRDLIRTLGAAAPLPLASDAATTSETKYRSR